MPNRERIFLGLAIVAGLLFPLAVLAQEPALAAEAAPTKLAKGWEFSITVFEMLSPILTILLGWVAVKLNSFLSTKIANETLAGVVARFSDSVFIAVKKVHQTLRDEIVKAKKPGTPGGTAITKDEAKKLKDAVWDELKAEYGGYDGMKVLLSVLKIEEGPLMQWIDNRIEAAVHDTGLLKKAATGNPK